MKFNVTVYDCEMMLKNVDVEATSFNEAAEQVSENPQFNRSNHTSHTFYADGHRRGTKNVVQVSLLR
jgi:hypothetical protein